MAVPFHIPEDQNEVEVILIQLQTLLNRLQIAVRQNRQSSTPSTPSTANRARIATPNRVRVRDPSSGASTSTAPNAPHNLLPDLLNNLARLASANGNVASLTAIPANANRSLRRRTNSESSNCDETKISITAIVKHGHIQDWNQVDVIERKNLESESILSKLMPTVSSCSLMTAMICFVGWHIFR
ncbi:uncharacterized protein LOC132695706 isoform X2 [Cylas formicarius]|uniref:uncharacterized protein LOC132695706 isoform X2 n=1 Tax=Cylas formicarius TaxID=197179 RepID=UPI002958BF75|nr:uncharacterized protein LOC132695706 isoform X2 [Cylas formicarius]